jgi:hypothetical protein
MHAMTRGLSRLIIGLPLAAALTVVAVGSQRQPMAAGDGLRWYKGNTHTHTLNSDGDSTPDDVVRWYREQRYDFLFLTDHNYLTDVSALQALHGADEQFLVIKGEEVTAQLGDKPLHINGLNVSRVVEPGTGSTVVEVLQRSVDAIRAADGVPHVNHPNFRWAITPEELGAIRNNTLFEVYNGHPMVNNLGGGDLPGMESMWDTILSQGTTLYGVASDDAHHFKRPWDLTASRPGMGWVVVRAASLDANAILAAMERGDFYSSTGVTLSALRTSNREVSLAVQKDNWSKYRIEFIGRDGRVLEVATDSPATYRIRGDEGYVRARVIESNGRMAWTQPVMLTAAVPAR